HRSDCTNADELRSQPERLHEVSWAPNSTAVFLVAIQVEALDRHRLLSDVTRVLADERVNLLSASLTTSRDRVAVSRFTFEMGDPKHLGHVLNVVRNVEGVYDVYRGDLGGLTVLSRQTTNGPTPRTFGSGRSWCRIRRLTPS
ncbi:ACT domain-containing protein, partial [Gordonia malaquae]